MLRTSLRKQGAQLLKAGAQARSLSSTSRGSLLSSTTPLKATLASKRSPLATAFQQRHASANAPDPNDSFLSGNTANYIDEMYMSWKEDPESVHVSW